jgi:low affinity Fe/Cu permease
MAAKTRNARGNARGDRPADVRVDPPAHRSAVSAWLARLSLGATEWAGSSWAFGIAVAVILVWAVTGPIFHYSDTWQLVINTGTTIVTFLMVFLIQRAQNKESKAVQLKLNEIVAAIEGASNRLIDVESLSEEDIDVLRKHYSEMSRLAEEEESILKSHSIDEARERSAAKKRARH